MNKTKLDAKNINVRNLNIHTISHDGKIIDLSGHRGWTPVTPGPPGSIGPTGTTGPTGPAGPAGFSSNTFPPGFILPYAGPFDKISHSGSGWLPCDGRAIYINNATMLFDAIGYTYGGGMSGASDPAGSQPYFRVPDLRGRTIFGDKVGGSSQLAATPGEFSSMATGIWRYDPSAALVPPDCSKNVVGSDHFDQSQMATHEHTMAHQHRSYAIKYQVQNALANSTSAIWGFIHCQLGDPSPTWAGLANTDTILDQATHDIDDTPGSMGLSALAGWTNHRHDSIRPGR